jgi:hypothetical protein
VPYIAYVAYVICAYVPVLLVLAYVPVLPCMTMLPLLAYTPVRLCACARPVLPVLAYVMLRLCAYVAFSMLPCVGLILPNNCPNNTILPMLACVVQCLLC